MNKILTENKPMQIHKKFTVDITLVPTDRLKHSQWRVVIEDLGTNQSKGLVTEPFRTNDHETAELAYNSLCSALAAVIGRRIIPEIELKEEENDKHPIN